MRKRNVAILFRLNKKEAEVLDKKVKKSGLNREAYLRFLVLFQETHRHQIIIP